MIKTLTQKQLYYICQKHKYIILRNIYNQTAAVNCGIANTKNFQHFKNSDKRTRMLSYYPCDFMEYISKKVKY